MRKCKDWIETYIEYTEKQESPEIFHQWVAIGVISAAIERHIQMDRGFYVLFPNLYIVLTSGSAWSRRTTALNIGKDMLEKLEKPPFIVSQKITPEALIQALKRAGEEKGSSSGVILSSEMSVFLGKCSTDQTLLGLLCDLYDGRREGKEWQYETRRLGVETLKSPNVTLIATSTPELIRVSMPASAIGGGFTGRIVFVHAERTTRFNPFPEKSSKEYKLEKLLLEDLNVIRNLHGEMLISEDARDWFTEWYSYMMDEEVEAALQPYYGRKHDTLIKLAAILSVAESDNLTIKEKHFERGLQMLNETEQFTLDTLKELGMSEVGEWGQLVLNVINRAGKEGMEYSNILRRVSYKMSAKDLQGVLTTLEQENRVEEFRLDMGDKKGVRMYRRKRR